VASWFLGFSLMGLHEYLGLWKCPRAISDVFENHHFIDFNQEINNSVRFGYEKSLIN
jgi:hypothetical protein